MPLLQVALEGLTGLNGKLWKEVDDSQLKNGIELDIPALLFVSCFARPVGLTPTGLLKNYIGGGGGF